MGLLVCPACEAAKLREGPTAKPAHCTLHSFVRVLLNSESELSPTFHWKLFEGEEKNRHSYLLGLHKAEQPVLWDFCMCCCLTWSYCDPLDILHLLEPHSLWDRSTQEYPVSKQNAEKQFPITDKSLKPPKIEFQHASLSKCILCRS